MRYLARKHGLYGNNEREKALIDMVYEGRSDFRAKFVKILYEEDDEKYVSTVARGPNLSISLTFSA